MLREYKEMTSLVKVCDPLEFLLYLKQRNMHVDYALAGDRTLLHMCIIEKRADLVSLLLDLGANPNTCTATNKTPLHVAVRLNSDADIVRDLLNREANVNVVCDEHRSPLYDAVAMGTVEIMQLLLDKDAKINTQDKYGRSLLLYSLEVGTLAKLKLLLSYYKNEVSSIEYLSAIKFLLSKKYHPLGVCEYLKEELHNAFTNGVLE